MFEWSDMMIQSSVGRKSMVCLYMIVTESFMSTKVALVNERT